MIKKIQSLLSLILCALLLCHLLFAGLLMGKIIVMQPCFILFTYAALFVMVAHVLLIFIPMLLNRNSDRERPYVRLNLRFYALRISGVVIALLLHFHKNTFTHPDVPIANVKWYEKIAIALTNPTLGVVLPSPATLTNIFYLIALIVLAVFCCFHASVAIPKALVGLGAIVSEKALAQVEKICIVFGSIICLFSIWGACVMASYSGIFGGAI